MNQQEVIKKIEGLMADATFAEKVKNAASLAEIAALFNNEGVSVSEEELKAALAEIPENGELNEDMLEKVSGGGFIAAAIIVYVGYKLLRGYIDGVRAGWNSCRG